MKISPQGQDISKQPQSHKEPQSQDFHMYTIFDKMCSFSWKANSAIEQIHDGEYDDGYAKAIVHAHANFNYDFAHINQEH